MTYCTDDWAFSKSEHSMASFLYMEKRSVIGTVGQVTPFLVTVLYFFMLNNFFYFVVHYCGNNNKTWQNTIQDSDQLL